MSEIRRRFLEGPQPKLYWNGARWVSTDEAKDAKDYSPPRAIFVDVDGTLISCVGQVNTTLLQFLRERKADGYELTLWSMRGREHAEAAVGHADCEGLFNHVISKPGYVVDDKGLTWLRDVGIIPVPL